MTENIKELVKRLDAGRTLLRADGDRDLGFQSNITTDTSMALADELKSAIDALEALAGEVERLTNEVAKERGNADQNSMQRDKARAECARLKAALERLRDCDWVISLPDRMDAVREIARKALGDAS